MKPVAIFRHTATEGPGYFAIYLERHGVPWQLIRIDEGEPVPERAARFGGLVFMGGQLMSKAQGGEAGGAKDLLLIEILPD